MKLEVKLEVGSLLLHKNHYSPDLCLRRLVLAMRNVR